jgi:hypothetical protein
MFSKYILASTWTPLENIYSFDKNITLNNRYYSVVGNMPTVYTPYLNKLKDYTNNNYSLMFLSKKSKLNNILQYQKPFSDNNNQTFLIATDLVNGLVSDKTLFLTLSNNNYVFVSISNIDKNSFFTYSFLSPSEALIYNFINNKYYFFVVDSFTDSITVVEKESIDNLTFSEINFLKTNYIINNNNNILILYKSNVNTSYTFKKDENNNFLLDVKDIQSLNNQNIFYKIDYSDLPKIETNIDWISYSRSIDQNNIDINVNRSIFNLENNFLFHSEYNTIEKNNIFTNFLTLKNQLNLKDNQTRTAENNNNRDYVSLYTGGDRELGFQKINLGYTTNHLQLNFLPDKTTWFHLPNNKNSTPININESNFILNGAIAGGAPIYSDKIWKKLANYASTSNMGNAHKKEHTGQWLCSWLSAGKDENIWVDRFYNSETFTPFEALKYSSNINYTPQYKNLYKPGIEDVPSTLTLEQGSWYAYSHMGKSTAKSILNGLNSTIIQKNLSQYNNSENSPYFYGEDADGDAVYNFDGSKYGAISIKDASKNFNNFTLSFFATREDWNRKENYQILGNYLDNGLGFFNDNSITPNIFYQNDSKLTILNRDNNEIQKINVTDFISTPNYLIPASSPGQFLTIYNDKILGLWYRGLTENFHIVTTQGYVLEFTANGTVVDVLSTLNVSDPLNFTGVSVHNNEKYGVVLFNDLRIVKHDLTSNKFEVLSSDTPNITFVNLESFLQLTNIERNARYYSVIIDPYDKIYVIYGQNAILKSTNIYFKDNRSLSVLVYDTVTNKINSYIDESKGFIDPINNTNLELAINKPGFITTGVRSISSFFIFLGYPENNKFDYLKYSLIDKKIILSGTYASSSLPAPLRPTNNGKFGHSLSLLYKDQLNLKRTRLTHDLIYVGAPYDSDGSVLSAGSVFCYKLSEDLKNNALSITFVDKMFADNPQTQDNFGHRVVANICDAIYDNGPDSFDDYAKLGVLVSAPNAQVGGIRPGKVYCYKKFIDFKDVNFTFGNATFQSILPPDPEDKERFGENISIDSYFYSPFTTIFRKRSFTDAIATCFIISSNKTVTAYSTTTSAFSAYINAGVVYGFAPSPSSYLDNQFLSGFYDDDIKINFEKLLQLSLTLSSNFYPLVNSFTVSSWDNDTNTFFYDYVVLSAADEKNIYKNRFLGSNFHSLNNYNAKSVTTKNGETGGLFYRDLRLQQKRPTTNEGVEVFFPYAKSIYLSVTGATVDGFDYVALSSKDGNDFGSVVIDNSIDSSLNIPSSKNKYIIALGGISNDPQKGYINFYGVSSIFDNSYSLIKSLSSDADMTYNGLSATDTIISEEDFFVYTGYRYSLSSCVLMVGDFASVLRNKIIQYEEPGEKINTFNFNKDQETYLLFNDKVKIYDVLGDFKEIKQLQYTGVDQTSSYNMGFTNYGNSSELFITAIDNNNKNYVYNFNTNNIKMIDSEKNTDFNTSLKLHSKPYSLTQDWMTQGYYDTVYPLPGYNIKIRLNNKLNYEDSLVLNYKVLGETLNSGTHHFAIVLNTVEGFFQVYLNGAKSYEKSFQKGKYSFVPVLTRDFIFGNTPFYGGTTYESFYNSKTKSFYVRDLLVEKVKLYKESLNFEEVKLLFYEKFAPMELITDIDALGYRNYIDSITRSFRHKKPGLKTNLINITINDSTIADKELKDYYESLILKELKRYLPVHVKVNSIRWLNNKKNDQVIPEGYFDSFISISTT